MTGGIATPVGGVATPLGGIATPAGGIATPVGGIATPIGVSTPTGIPGMGLECHEWYIVRSVSVWWCALFVGTPNHLEEL